MSLIEDDILPRLLRQRWTSLIFAGVILVCAGIFGIITPLASGLTLTTLIGASLCVSGLFQGIHAFAIKNWPLFAASLLMGILLFAAGLFLLLAPLTGVALLILTLALALAASGLAEIAAAFWLRPLRMWQWSAISGLVSVVAGIFIWTRADTAGAWLLGFAAGAGLLSSGITLILLGLAGRRAERQHIA